MVSSLRHQPSGSPSQKSIIISLNPRATSYESMDVRKETMFSKPLCKTDVWGHLHLPQRNAVNLFEVLIDPSSTADRQNVTYVILFYDDTGEVWEFTYCQWRKRDGYDYAFSKGWLNFAKAKKLKVNDTVTFLRGQTNQEQFFISYTLAGNINGAIQQPSGGDWGQPAALLSSRTSDQVPPSPSAIALADSLSGPENMEHSPSGQRHIDTDFDTILDQPYTDTMEQNPLANHPTPTAALLSSRTSDQGSPSPGDIASTDSILETENMEHSLSVARVRGPEITVLPVGSPSFNASGTGIVPNTAVTDRSPTLNSDQVISTLNFDQITSTLNPEQITSTLRIQFFELHKINELALEYDYGMQDMIFKSLLKFIKEYTTTTEEQEAQNQIMPVQALFSRMRNMQVTISNRIQPFTLR